MAMASLRSDTTVKAASSFLKTCGNSMVLSKYSLGLGVVWVLINTVNHNSVQVNFITRRIHGVAINKTASLLCLMMHNKIKFMSLLTNQCSNLASIIQVN